MTLEQAKGLEVGQVLYHTTDRRRDGKPVMWRVSGQVKVWVRNPERVKVPVKHGLYRNDYLTEGNLGYLQLTEELALERGTMYTAGLRFSIPADKE